MHLQEIRNILALRPFRPFRLFVSDGAVYDVRHPELCVPGTRSVFIGTPAVGQPDPVFDRFVLVDWLHITRLEPLEVLTPGNGQS